MIKFEVYKECDIEMRRKPVDYTVKDLENFSLSRTSTFHELIKSFDTLDEARIFFEKEKEFCVTRSTDGYTFPLILFDELQLCETEYEDEDFIQMDIIDSYISDDDCLIFGDSDEI